MRQLNSKSAEEYFRQHVGEIVLVIIITLAVLSIAIYFGAINAIKQSTSEDLKTSAVAASQEIRS